jgi:hypothetical protein
VNLARHRGVLLGLALAASVLSACTPVTGSPAPAPLQSQSGEPAVGVRPGAQPTGLGGDADLDRLAESCGEGVLRACDQLVQASPPRSRYEDYGATCGGRNPRVGSCVTWYTPTVVAQVIRDSYVGSCPPPASRAPSFRAVIGVQNGPITVTYQWLTSNGGSSDPSVKTVSFRGTGPQQTTVTFTQTGYRPGQTVNDWIALYTVSPVATESNHIGYTTTCQ